MSFQGTCTLASTETAPFPATGGVVEFPLLLPQWQAAALEDLAHTRGLTAAEMVRQVLSGYLARARTNPDARRV